MTLSEHEDHLWRALEDIDPSGWERLGYRRWNSNPRIRIELNAFLGWIICPRAHAVAHHMYVLDIRTAHDPTLGARADFHKFGRYTEGPDPVFALGDLQ